MRYVRPVGIKDAACWVSVPITRHRHLADCDYFKEVKDFRVATPTEIEELVVCKWCSARMQMSLEAV